MIIRFSCFDWCCRVKSGGERDLCGHSTYGSSYVWCISISSSPPLSTRSDVLRSKRWGHRDLCGHSTYGSSYVWCISISSLLYFLLRQVWALGSVSCPVILDAVALVGRLQHNKAGHLKSLLSRCASVLKERRLENKVGLHPGFHSIHNTLCTSCDLRMICRSCH